MLSGKTIRAVIIAVSFVFAIGVFLASPCAGVFLLVLAGGITWGTIALVEQYVFKPPVRAFCPSCGKYLPSDLSWICGRCHQEHFGDNVFSFLNRCRNCKHAPSAYQCHHNDCEAIIYLDHHYDASYCAYGVGRPEPEMTEKRKRKEKIEAVQDDVQLLQAGVEKFELIEKLEAIEQRISTKKVDNEPQTPPSLRDLLLKQWEKRQGGADEIKAVVEMLREKARNDYRNNPIALKEALDAIEEYQTEMLKKVQLGELG